MPPDGTTVDPKAAAVPPPDPKMEAQKALEKQMVDKVAADKAAAGAGAADAAAKAASDAAAAQAKADSDASAAKAKADDEKALWMRTKAEEEAKKPFELKLPEGAKLEPAALLKFGAEMKTLGLSQEQAQKFLERDLAAKVSQQEADRATLKAANAKWGEEIKATWGSAKYAENAEHAKRGFDLLDPDGSMRKDLETSNLHNWPKLVYAAERIGRMIAEDRLGVRTAGKTEEKLSAEQRIEKQYRENARKAEAAKS